MKIRSTSGNHAIMQTPFSWGWVPPLRHDSSFSSFPIAGLGQIFEPVVESADHHFRPNRQDRNLGYYENKVRLRQSCEHADSIFMGLGAALRHDRSFRQFFPSAAEAERPDRSMAPPRHFPSQSTRLELGFVSGNSSIGGGVTPQRLVHNISSPTRSFTLYRDHG